MEDESVSDSFSIKGSRVTSAPLTYTEVFRLHLPYYLAIGMTWEQFWEEDVDMVRYYREADRIRRKRKAEELWLNGRYIYEAIGDLSPILRFSMSKQARRTPFPYLEEPFPIDYKDAEEREQAKAKAQMEKNKASLTAWAVRVNQRRKEVNKKDGIIGNRQDTNTGIGTNENGGNESYQTEKRFGETP